MDNNTIVNATQPIDDPEIENGIPPGAVGRLGRPYGGGVGKRHDEQSWFALAPDGQLVATGHRDGAARLWDLATGKVTHILRHAVRSSQMFMKVAFALDGERIATTLQTSVCVWTRGGTKLLTLEVEATDIAFAQDGRLIAFTRELIRAFDVDGRESWRWQTPTQTQLAAIHPDGETCVALDRDGTGLLRQIGSVRPIKIAASGLQSIAFGPDRKLVVAADEPWLSAWKLSAEAVMRCELPPESERPNSVALAPDGQHYAVSARTESAIVDMNTGVRRALRSGQRGRSLDQLTWAAGGRVIGGWNDAQLQLWDSATGLDLRTRTGPGGRVNAAASSEDGQVIATARASDDTHEVELWHAEQPDAPRARLPVGDKAVLEIALSRDGRTLVVTTTASALQYWDTQSATRRHTEDIAGGITAPTFCRDGTLVAIANQAVVQLRDPASGALVT
ncbi:MAG: hypothetical protein JWO36_1756, partial [Myxococcales bacterium]|nr:hypothetical protein [Myxococcales bacterium]